SEFGIAHVAVIKRVLAAVDLSDMDAEVVRSALGVAPQDGEVHLLHVLEPHSDKKAEHAARLRLEALLAPSQHVRRAVTHLVVRRGESPHDVIATYAERMAADAICMGMKKRSRAADLLLGSQSHGVIRSARVPVILVPAGQGTVSAMRPTRSDVGKSPWRERRSRLRTSLSEGVEAGKTPVRRRRCRRRRRWNCSRPP
ncbi:MAG TPA: universal stress protein, partial [Steroidobacteraceae bacterium]